MDTEFYHPAQKDNDILVILLTGNPTLTFKGFSFAFEVLQLAYELGLRFMAKWVSQVPVRQFETEFPLEISVMPSQEELAGLYRNADIFLSASLYESHPLPPLEAMASGTAVIAADCGGIRAYAVDGENCLLCRQGDKDAMLNALAKLLGGRKERERLALAGRKTALAHSAENAAGLLESRLSGIVLYGGTGG